MFGKRNDPCGDCDDGYCTMNCGPVVRSQERKAAAGVFDLKKARQRVAGVRADLIGAGVEWRHVKSGKKYWVESVGIREADGEPLAVYRDSDVGTCWIRPAVEFCDGRFVRAESR